MANIRSIAFNGSTGYVSRARNNFCGLATGTIECWYKATHSTTAYQKLAYKNGNIDFGISQDFGGGNCKLFASITGVGDLGEFEEADHANGRWNHTAITWDGSFLRAYINGVYKKRVAQSGSQADNDWGDLYLGYDGSAEWLVGNIDEFRISDTARYTTETSFTTDRMEFINDANTLILWHFDDSSGTSVVDSSSSSPTNTGTLNGGVTFSTEVPFAGNSNISNKYKTFEVGNGMIRSESAR
jgi:hypothetical protein